MGKELSKSYYFDTIKIVRDLVHGYVNLTEFELELIDTVSFQRLKDIRQLTCQGVYPAARHTRFEHSLGVLELTRRAIKHINKNGCISKKYELDQECIINKELEFNATIAALLHDVGHCPFSHMGESEFDSEIVREYLCDSIKSNEQIGRASDLIDKISRKRARNIGAVHEQLSCIIILEKYYNVLSDLTIKPSSDEEKCDIKVDFELIIRSILGIEYNIRTLEEFESNKVKNIIVRLINSKIFDMDKLDYIMRDSYFTGIGAPEIDTKRLFRNMYLSDSFSLVFTSKAVPSLQNMIDSRDGLYMYVYNHHAVIFSDFMNTYISRRLSHNASAFLRLIYPDKTDEEMNDELEVFQISSLGLIPKPYLFSVGAVVEGERSDSDWLSLLNIIHTHYQDSRETIQQIMCSEISEIVGNDIDVTQNLERLSNKIYNALKLVHEYKTRQFLKPWWKTVFEFSNFMHQHFRDDNIRGTVGKWICNGGKYGLEAAELRSQIAKHVIFLTRNLSKEDYPSLIRPLDDGEFFVIQRSTRFFAPDTIESLEICLKSSEITGPPIDVNYQIQEYYVKKLTNIIPQKNYSSIYAKEGFYIFSRPAPKEEFDNLQRKNYYKMLEKIFVFVATEFIHRGEQDFIYRFQLKDTKDGRDKTQVEIRKLETQYEDNSMREMLNLFRKQCIL